MVKRSDALLLIACLILGRSYFQWNLESMKKTQNVISKNYPPTKAGHNQNTFFHEENIFPNKNLPHCAQTHIHTHTHTQLSTLWDSFLTKMTQQQQQTTTKLDPWISFILKLTEIHWILLWTATTTKTTKYLLLASSHSFKTACQSFFILSTKEDSPLSSFSTVFHSESFLRLVLDALV